MGEELTTERPSIYRSKHPDVWAAMHAYAADWKAFAKAVRSFRKRFSVGRRETMSSDGFGSKRLAGFSAIDDDWRTPPKGWRFIRTGGHSVIVPYRSKAKGDPELIAAYDAVPFVCDFRTTWPGIPVDTWRLPGAHPDADEEYMYADWGDGKGPDPAKVDAAIWEPVLRSEYHRLKESGAFDLEASRG